MEYKCICENGKRHPQCKAIVHIDEYDFEVDATTETLCGRLGRKHQMKRIHHSKTICVYPGCDGYC